MINQCKTRKRVTVEGVTIKSKFRLNPKKLQSRSDPDPLYTVNPKWFQKLTNQHEESLRSVGLNLNILFLFFKPGTRNYPTRNTELVTLLCEEN